MIRISRFLILFSIFAVALTVWKGYGMSAIEIKEPVVQMTCLTAFVLFFLDMLLFRDKISLSRDPLVIFVVLYAALMTAAYFRTNQCSLHYEAWLTQLSGIITFMVVICCFDKADVGTLVRCCVAVAVIASLYALSQYFYMDPLHRNIEMRKGLRVISFFGNKNYFAIFLLLMIPMGGWLVIGGEKKRHPASLKRRTGGRSVIRGSPIFRFVGTISVAVMVLVLALSNSRGAFAGFFLAVLISGLMLGWKQRNFFGSRKHLKKLAVFCTLPALLIGVVLLSRDIREDYLKRLRHRSHYIDQRLTLYQAAAEVVGRHPLLGVGPGNFGVSYPENEKYKVNTHAPSQIVNHVHNDILEIWAEYGLFTLLAYLGILLLFARKWLTRFRDAGEPGEQTRLILICCSLTGYLSYSQLTVASRYVSSVFYFWLVMGIAYLYLGETSDKAFFSVSNRLKLNRKVAFAVFFMAAILIFGPVYKKTLANYFADVYTGRAYGFAIQGDHDKALEYLNRAVASQSDAVEAYYQRGFAHFAKNQLDKALDDYRKVNDLVPNYVNVNFNLASCFYKKGNWPETIRMAGVSHRLFPDYLPPVMLLAYAHYHMGQFEKSLFYCDLVLKRYQGHKPALNLRQKLEKKFNKKEEDYDSNA